MSGTLCSLPSRVTLTVSAPVGSTPPRGGDHVGELQARLVERIAAGARHHAEHRDLPAAQRGESHVHLRVVQELAALERVGDLPGGGRGREPGDLHRADQRHRDAAVVRNPRFEREIGLLEHRHAHRVAHPELIACLRQRQAAHHPEHHPQHEPHHSMSHIASLEFRLSFITV
jgi:hypothetical protein